MLRKEEKSARIRSVLSVSILISARKGMMKMKVRATDKYEKLNLTDKELNRIPKKGEEFEVTKERFEVLTKVNSYNVAFVEEVKEKTIKVETATKKVETEKAVKKTTKKAK